MGLILPKSLAEEILFSGPGLITDIYLYVDDIRVDSDRWMEHRQLVISDPTGNLFAADYEIGLTEYQDTPIWYGLKEIEFYPVSRHPITVYEYRRNN